ncbi:hypothetical protein DMUE_4170 [Dictyocoela muelleri]|nr:hypothetical protein DMUE_4170 [Dictyocoela muelleri]
MNNEYKKTKEQKTSHKFCKYHKSKSHNTNECIAISKIKNKKNTRNEGVKRQETKLSHNYGITTQLLKTNVIEIPIKINDMKLNAMIDTRADKNYISTDIVTELKLEKLKLESPLPAE